MEDHFKSIEDVLERYQSAVADDQQEIDGPDVARAAESVSGTVLTDRERLEIIVHKLKFIPPEQRVKVTYLHDVAPVSISQNEYIDHLIRIAGGIPLNDPAVADFDPNVLIILSERPIGQLLSELPGALSASFWPQTDAVRNNNVFVVHHPDYLRIPGSRLAEDTEILAEIINPGYFVYGRDEDVWMRFNV